MPSNTQKAANTTKITQRAQTQRSKFNNNQTPTSTHLNCTTIKRCGNDPTKSPGAHKTNEAPAEAFISPEERP